MRRNIVIAIAALALLLVIGALARSESRAEQNLAPAPAHQTLPLADVSCEPPLLDFRVVARDAADRPVFDADGRPMWEPALVLGRDGELRHLSSAYLRPTATVYPAQIGFGIANVQFEFTDEGAALFDTLVEQQAGQVIGIFVDNVLINAPSFPRNPGHLGAGLIIVHTQEEAQQLADRLNAEATHCPRDVSA